MKDARALIFAVMLAAAGCAGRGGPGAVSSSSQPTTLPAQSLLSLDELQIPAPPATQPVASVDSPAPLQALEHFARARGALFDNQPFTAISELEKAIALDPSSFDAHYLLARAYAAANDRTEKGINSLQSAIALRADSLEALTDLARAYFSTGKLDEARTTLLRARQTKGYQDGADYSALVDYYLARTLQQQGYVRAAIECYDSFLNRLKYARPSYRHFAELSFFERRPEGLYNQIGGLYQQLGDHDNAVRCFQLVADRSPRDFPAQATLVKAQVSAGRMDDALTRSRQLVLDFRASRESIELLQFVGDRSGRKQTVASELRRLLDADPEDRVIRFALVEALKADGQIAQARAVLQQAMERSPNNIDVLKRILEIEIARGDTSAAMVLLVEQSAKAPESLPQLLPLWERLLNDPGIPLLRTNDLLRLRVTSEAEAARQFWISQQASLSARGRLVAASLDKSTELAAFAPAYRAMINRIWGRGDWNDARKIDACRDLTARARSFGNEALAVETEAMCLVNQGKTADALTRLARAIEIAPSAPVLLSHSQLLKATGNTEKSEQQLWKLISDFPTFPGGYQSLVNLAVEKSDGQLAQRIIQTWLNSDPESTDARLFQAAIFRLGGQRDVAEGIMLQLLREYPWNSEVVSNFVAFHQQGNRVDECLQRLEEVRSKEPRNRVLVQSLVELLLSQQRGAEASRIVDAYTQAVAADPARLYFAGPLYNLVGQRELGEQAYERVLQLNPRHPGANNDLGYGWADEGKNLDRAESMIRIAVEQEPDNESFLDSLGWVLYKRGQFGEARDYLSQAIAPGAAGDPVTIDHLGDAQYRLNETAAAVKQWTAARERVEQLLKAGSDRGDLSALQLSLQNKLRQVEQGQTVSVAPAVEQAQPGDHANRVENKPSAE